MLFFSVPSMSLLIRSTELRTGLLFTTCDLRFSKVFGGAILRLGSGQVANLQIDILSAESAKSVVKFTSKIRCWILDARFFCLLCLFVALEIDCFSGIRVFRAHSWLVLPA